MSGVSDSVINDSMGERTANLHRLKQLRGVHLQLQNHQHVKPPGKLMYAISTSAYHEAFSSLGAVFTTDLRLRRTALTVESIPGIGVLLKRQNFYNGIRIQASHTQKKKKRTAIKDSRTFSACFPSVCAFCGELTEELELDIQPMSLSRKDIVEWIESDDVGAVLCMYMGADFPLSHPTVALTEGRLCCQ